MSLAKRWNRAFFVSALALASLTSMASAWAIDTPRAEKKAAKKVSTTVRKSPTTVSRSKSTTTGRNTRPATSVPNVATQSVVTSKPAALSKSVVFFGDSITESWGNHPKGFFPGKPYVAKGISGETTKDFLKRFESDVISQRPGAVHLWGGINDLAWDESPQAVSKAVANMGTMIDAANRAGIRVVLASVLPIGSKSDGMTFFLKRQEAVMKSILQLNAQYKALAEAKGAVYVDYFAVVVDSNGELASRFNSDNVHPTYLTFDTLTPVAKEAIFLALQ